MDAGIENNHLKQRWSTDKGLIVYVSLWALILNKAEV